ncbi:unnamed protein product [Phytophthora fragariaefolia]|uniref:Unnamed protein product n=1 Tax=Phytophthora fragariaefolia TaxID=1490495 RepID=A0A9W6Y8X5_9STRA|nr:unnamed protein product [Phytophthora fragariaefolia]
MYRQNEGGSEIFTAFAMYGYLGVVKFLYDTGRIEPEVIRKGFVMAALGNSVDVMEFLLDTGHITTKDFDEAFTHAVNLPNKCTQALRFLCDKKRVSPAAVNQAFQSTLSYTSIKFLYENECISNEAIVAAFKNAAGCGGDNRFGTSYTKEQVKIAMLLCKDNGIPPAVIDEACVSAARNGQIKLFMCLSGDSRISPGKISEAFVAATTNGHLKVVKYLRRDTRISLDALNDAFVNSAGLFRTAIMKRLYSKERLFPETIFKAFTEAASHGSMGNVQELAKYLSVEAHVPSSLKCKAFIYSATLSRQCVVETLGEQENSVWPLQTLKQALDAAQDEGIKNYIRKKLCDQLVDPVFPGRFDAVATLIANWTRAE